MQDWLGGESALLHSTDSVHPEGSPRVSFGERGGLWCCTIKVADGRLEFRDSSAPDLTASDREGLERFAALLQELLGSPELSQDLFDMEEEVQGLIDTSLHLLASLSPEGKILRTNQRQRESSIGRPIWEAPWLAEESSEGVMEAVERAREEKVSPAIRVMTSRDSVYELLFTPLLDLDGQVSSIVVRGKDPSDRERMRTVLLEEREFLRAVLENIDEAILACELDGTVSLVNAAASTRFGLQKGDQAFQRLTFVNGENGESLPLRENPLSRVLHGEALRELAAACLDQDGEIRLISLSGCRLVDSDGESYGAVVALRDITRRRRAEQARTQSERRLRAIFNSQPNALLSLDSQGHIVRCNPAAHSLLGYYPDELSGRFVGTLLAAKVGAAVDFSGEREVQLRRADGEIVWAIVNTVSVRDAEGDLGVMWIVQDISEAKRAQAELDRSQRRLAESREMERTRLARELHDDAVQNLIAVSYRLKDNELRSEVLGVVRQLRGLISDLRPPGLNEFGLEAALEGLLAKLKRQAQHQIPSTELLCYGLGDLPEALAVGLFRVVQEAATNAFKHSGASSLKIELRRIGSAVKVDVIDNGCGFDLPQDWNELTARERFGLAGLQERVELLKGSLSVSSEPGKGTRLLASLPVATGCPEPK